LIIVKISEGLGNQIYQYAFAQMLRDSGQNVFLYLDFKRFLKAHEKYSLDKVFEVNIPFVKDFPDKYTLFSAFNSQNLFIRILRKLFILDIISLRNILIDHFEKITGSSIKTKVIESHFFPKNYSKNSQLKLISQLRDYENSHTIENTDCFIHIRRGDTINPKISKYRAILGVEYYEKAIKQMKEKYGITRFFFFSDDIEWVKSKFKEPSFIFIIDHSATNILLFITKYNRNIIKQNTKNTMEI